MTIRLLNKEDKEYLSSLTSLQNDEFTLQISNNFIKIRNILQNIEPNNTEITNALISIVDGNVKGGKIFFKNICLGMTIKKALNILLKLKFNKYVIDIILICIAFCEAILINYYILMIKTKHINAFTIIVLLSHLIYLYKNKLSNTRYRFYYIRSTILILLILLNFTRCLCCYLKHGLSKKCF